MRTTTSILLRMLTCLFVVASLRYYNDSDGMYVSASFDIRRDDTTSYHVWDAGYKRNYPRNSPALLQDRRPLQTLQVVDL